MKRTYQAIDCGLYDNLEIWAMKKLKVDIVYKDENNLTLQTYSRITNLKASDGVEYMILEDNTMIRLDDIITINGITYEGSSCSIPPNA